MRLSKLKFARAALRDGIRFGVLTDIGPGVARFHRRLPNGKYAKRYTKVDSKRYYEVKPSEEEKVVVWEPGIRGNEQKYAMPFTKIPKDKDFSNADD
tara:strand:- start:110 stop:400 length:291 start_codon:yes stop_codon:yes gene_type:complete